MDHLQSRSTAAHRPTWVPFQEREREALRPFRRQALSHCKVILDRYAELAQDGSVIENFRNKGLARFFEDDDRRKLPASQIDKIARILARLNEAITVQDMGLPGYRLHPLKGELAGFLVCDRVGQLAYHFSIRER